LLNYILIVLIRINGEDLVDNEAMLKEIEEFDRQMEGFQIKIILFTFFVFRKSKTKRIREPIQGK
jgi:hypothetical protein